MMLEIENDGLMNLLLLSVSHTLPIILPRPQKSVLSADLLPNSTLPCLRQPGRPIS